MSRFVRRPAANRDLVAAYRDDAREAGLRVADRFFASAEATFKRLARMPGLGTRYASNEPLYAELRYFPISRFSAYQVFYRPIPRGIEVLRVLHGARHLPEILAEEFGEGQEPDTGEDEDEPHPG